jgi:hypothetical protein
MARYCIESCTARAWVLSVTLFIVSICSLVVVLDRTLAFVLLFLHSAHAFFVTKALPLRLLVESVACDMCRLCTSVSKLKFGETGLPLNTCGLLNRDSV